MKLRIPVLLWLTLCLVSPAWAATITAAGNGNWGTGGTWVGGVKPGVGDTAEAGGFTVTIDEDLTCTALQNTAGGGYIVTSAPRSITAAITAIGATCLTCSHSTGTVTVTGAVTGSAGTASAYGINKTSAGTLAIVGNVTGGGAAAAYGARLGGPNTISGNVYAKTPAGIYHYGGTMTVTGNIYGSDTAAGDGIVQSSSVTLNVFGNVYGGAGGAGVGILMQLVSEVNITGSVYAKAGHGITNSVGGTITVLGGGTVTGSNTTASKYGIYNVSTGAVNITANVVGGTQTSAYGINLAAASTLTMTGNITGGTGTTAYGLSMAAGSTANVTGNVYGKAAHGVNMGAATLTVNGTAYGSDTTASIYGVYAATNGAVVSLGSSLGGTQTNANGTVAGGITLTVTTATGGTGSSAYGVSFASAAVATAAIDTAYGNDYGPGTAVAGPAEGVYSGISNASSVCRIRRSIAGARGCAGHRGAVTFTRSASSYIEVRENIGGQFYKRRYVLDTKGRP